MSTERGLRPDSDKSGIEGFIGVGRLIDRGSRIRSRWRSVFGRYAGAANDNLPTTGKSNTWTDIRKHHILDEIMVPSRNRRPRKQPVDCARNKSCRSRLIGGHNRGNCIFDRVTIFGSAQESVRPCILREPMAYSLVLLLAHTDSGLITYGLHCRSESSIHLVLWQLQALLLACVGSYMREGSCKPSAGSYHRCPCGAIRLKVPTYRARRTTAPQSRPSRA